MKLNKLRNKRLKDLGFKSNLKLLDRSIINWDDLKVTKEDIKEMFNNWKNQPCEFMNDVEVLTPNEYELLKKRLNEIQIKYYIQK